MNRIPQTFIDDLLSRIDIVDIIDHRVKLKKSGKNYSACCPFHDEKTPSFTVSQEKQFYYCFGCGATGSALTFLIEYERLGFIDAVENLAKTAGIEVPRETSKVNKAADSKRKKLYQVLEKAAQFYGEHLKSHPQRDNAVRYLKERGLTGSIAKDFMVGYAPQGWDNLLGTLGTSSDTQQSLIDAGLVISKQEDDKQYDRFRHRIMYPIRDVRGRVIGFGGRVLGNDKPKYLNSPETDVFYKSRELYGLYEARQANRQLDQLLVVEGYMDVIALAQYDITNAVATLGTACGEDHLQLAFRYTSHIVFCFDGDNAGRKAAKRALLNSLSSMQDGRQIRFLFLAEGQDPDTLVRHIGKDRFISELDNAQPLEEFLFDVAAEGLDIGTMEGRARFSKVAAPLINLLPEGVFRELMFGSLATRTGLSAEILRELTKEPIKVVEDSKPELEAPQQNASLPNTNLPNKKAELNTHTNKPHDDIGEYTENDIYLSGAYETNSPDDHYNDYSNEHNNIQVNETHPHLEDISAGGDELYESFSPESTQTHAPPKPQWNTSRLAITSEKAAIILLLKDPQLLKGINNLPEIFKDGTSELDGELLMLKELIDYLYQRPDATFNKILGYWAGAKSIEEQQNLRQLVASSELKAAKTLNNFNASEELKDVFSKISKHVSHSEAQIRLKKMTQKGLSNLSDDEKALYRELVSQNKR